MLRHLLPLLALLFGFSAQAAPESLLLTEQEQAWLKAHPTLRLGIDPDWAPFEYFDKQGRYSGMAADYMRLLSDKLGISMEPVEGLSWVGVLLQAQNKQLDILPAATATPQRETYLNFTAPYLDFPMVIVTRSDAPFISSLEALLGQRVAVVKSYVSHETLTRNYPQLTLVPEVTIQESLEALSNGDVDAFVGNIASISHAIQQLGLSNLKVAAHTPYSFKLGIGVRDDWPELVTILDKALRSISSGEKMAIQQKWGGVQIEAGVKPITVLLSILSVILIAAVIVVTLNGINKKLRREIEERRQVEQQLRLSEEALNESQRTAKIGWWQWDLCNNTLKWSDEVFTITGKDPQSFIPTPENFMSVVHPDDLPGLGGEIQQILDGKGERYDREFRIVRDDGSLCHVHSYGKFYGSSIDNSRYFAGVLHDITERKAAEEQLRQQAYHDTLTDLPNRNYFMQQLEKTLALSRRHGYYSALLFFDLDNFKIINDTLGHHSGDKLLTEVGMRLRQTIRQEDTAARLGGDEFVVIATNLGSDQEQAAEQARLIAEKIHDSLSLPISIEEHEHHLTLSTGISLFPVKNEDSNDILKFADTAMYRAKEGGRDTIRFFRPSMQHAAEERFALQGKMRQALLNEEYELHYQPQYNTQGEIIGAESLLRWHQSEMGMVSPARFIPLAEESGMIIEIGKWVLQEACRQIKSWSEQGIEIETLAVNVSPKQFQQADFVHQVETIIQESGISPNHLELELTEGILVENINDVTSKVGQLQGMGIRFAIDDFGTGYSSLRYLQQLPLDKLKIDQSFVRDIHSNESNAHIVETIISMAHHLDMELIAEGVETVDEKEFLDIRGCNKFQGYLFSKPLPAAELSELLQKP